MDKLLLFISLLVSVNGALLGANKCTWGPSYWCKSFSSADECGALEHCSKNAWLKSGHLYSLAVVEDSDACTFCKDMITDIKTYMASNETRTTIVQYMNRVCDFMPDEYSRQECSKIEQHYLDHFLSLIQKDVDPQTICSLAQLCGSSKQPSAAAQPAKALVRVPIMKAAPHDSDEQTCAMCKAFMAILSNEIKDTKNQDAIKALLLKECAQIGGEYAQQCQSLVTSYLPEVFALLEQELGENACQVLTLCPSSSAADLATATRSRISKWIASSGLSSHLKGVSARLGDELCDTCEQVAGFAKIFLSNNATEGEVAQALENDVCSQLGSFSSLCNQAVEDYLPMVWSEVLTLLDPATLCTNLGLCSTSTTAAATTATTPATTPKPVKQRARASVQCVICQYVMSKLESMLSDNATETEIIDTVEKVCKLLPKSVERECDNLVKTYGGAIIHLLVQEVQPSVICGVLGLCASGDSLYMLPLKPLKTDNCMLCELVMSYVQSTLSKNATEQEVEETLEKVCNFLSGTMAQECNSLIKQYAPTILKMLADDINPKDICTKLGMCQSMKVDGLVHLYRSSDNS